MSYTIPNWTSTLIVGHNDHSSAFTAETLRTIREKNYVTARLEIVDKNELEIPGTYRVKALTAGYTRDVWSNMKVVGGVGGNVTIYDIPNAIEGAYGSNPRSLYFFVRFKSAPSAMAHMHHHM